MKENMDGFRFIDGLTGLQRRLIEICRALGEDENALMGAKDILRVLAVEDWKMDESDFDYDCEALSGQVGPIESYPPQSVGYAYRQILKMGQPWHCRYPYFDLRGMYGDLHDDETSSLESVELRLSRFTNIVLPFGKAPLLPVSLLNGVLLPDGTEVPSHNLEELWTAYEYIRQDPEIMLDDLIEVLPGPDFAPGGVVGGPDAIRSLFEKGEGVLSLRADIRTEIEGGRTRIAITSLTPGVPLKTILKQLRSLPQNLVAFYDIKDRTVGERVRIVLDAPRKWSAAELKEILFRETDLERKVAFRYSAGDESGWPDRGALISSLKRAAVRCSPAWERKDGEPTDYIPLLRQILQHGGYKSPLADLTDSRRSRILDLH